MERDVPVVEPKPEPEPEPEPEDFALMTTYGVDYLNVRSSPGIADNILGRIGRGTRLRPDARYVSGEDIWLRWGKMGWSAEWYAGRRYLVPVNPSYALENDPNER